MRSEIGKIDLDRTFEERESLNLNIKEALNEASAKWGI
jgi:regulator of protease activity HflC (stomatin/prohibitin superfamily)